jgi:hypothetical protein
MNLEEQAQGDPAAIARKALLREIADMVFDADSLDDVRCEISAMLIESGESNARQ